MIQTYAYCALMIFEIFAHSVDGNNDYGNIEYNNHKNYPNDGYTKISQDYSQEYNYPRNYEHQDRKYYLHQRSGYNVENKEYGYNHNGGYGNNYYYYSNRPYGVLAQQQLGNERDYFEDVNEDKTFYEDIDYNKIQEFNVDKYGVKWYYFYVQPSEVPVLPNPAGYNKYPHTNSFQHSNKRYGTPTSKTSAAVTKITVASEPITTDTQKGITTSTLKTTPIRANQKKTTKEDETKTTTEGLTSTTTTIAPTTTGLTTSITVKTQAANPTTVAQTTTTTTVAETTLSTTKASTRAIITKTPKTTVTIRGPTTTKTTAVTKATTIGRD